MQLSNVCMVPGPNMLVMAFSDVRQVVAISTVGTPADWALATPALATIRQNRLVARSLPLVVHDIAGSSSATLAFGLIIGLLRRSPRLMRCGCARQGSRRARSGPLNLRTRSHAQSTMPGLGGATRR